MLKKQLRRLFALLVGVLLIGSTLAATERFDYDPLGRLIRVVSETQTTEYVYDAAGNILEVKTGVAATPPSVSGIAPSSLRRGETKNVLITGNNFTGAAVSSSNTGLDVANLRIAATQIQFDLTASRDATLGAQPIQIASAAGSATATITVVPLLPSVNVDPAPLAIPPDSVVRQFTIRLSHADTVDHVIAIASSNANMVVSPSSITVPAGETSVKANIKGVSAGQATLTLASATLGTSAVPVFITAEFKGITTSMAPNLGVVLEGVLTPTSTQITPVASQLLGVLVGSALRDISPDKVAVGTESATLTISGTGLETAASVSVEPSTGITLGTPTVAADGSRVSVTISVANDAAIGQRRIVVKNAAGAAFPAASASADRISTVRAAPEIHSVEPLFGTADSTISLTIRGRNLHDAEAILFYPSTGIVTDAMPVVNGDGTVLTAKVALALNAPAGEYVVAVKTPGGTSSATAGSANTFRIVNEIQQAVTPIMAPSVGVVLQDKDSQTSTPIGLTSPAVGVAFGPVASSLSPAVGIVGQDITLTIEGSELSGVTAVDIMPNTGLSIGSATVAADGKSVTVPVSIASDAMQTLRRVKVMAGASEVPFASPEKSQLRISLPVPEIDSVTPITLQTGQAAVPLVIRGRNFKDASQVKITPAADMTITTPPTVNGDGTEVTVNISAAASAATGPRLVTVITPAGESSTSLGVTNTITLANSAGATYTPILASNLGIVKLAAETPPPSVEYGPFMSTPLGVVLESVPAPVSTTTTQFADKIGVILGPTAYRLGADGFAPGFNGTLVIEGQELGAVTAVTVNPATGITLGTPTVSADGKQVSVTMTVDAAAPRGPRTVRLSTASGSIAFADPANAVLSIGPGVPKFDSITPILGEQGKIAYMLIRGSNLFDAFAVTATPSAGLNFVPGTLYVNSLGTELTVDILVDADAPLGSRIIQALVPGAASSAEPTPANTFTVYSP